MSLRGRLTPLRTTNFRWFFLGEVVNTAGSSMAGVALAFAVLEISDSASALGLVVAASTVPMVAFMLIGGALADRLPRALVLRGCNLVQGITQAVAAGLVISDRAQIWQLIVLQFVNGTVFAVSYPAFHGMVPILLPPEERKAGYLLIGQSNSMLRIAGPAVSGVLVATAGPGWALGVDAATFFVASGFLALLRLPFGERPERQSSVIGDFVVGWSYVRGLGWVVPAACCSLVFNGVSSGAIGVLGPVVADDTIGSDGWGLARSGQAVGLFVAAFFLAKITISRPIRASILGFSVGVLPMVVLASWVTTPGLAAAFIVAGAGLGVVDLAWNLAVQEKIPEEMLSRVMSIDGFFSFVGMPIGQALVGPLILLFSIRSVELGSVVLCLLVAAFGLSYPAFNNLRLTDPPTATATD